MVITINQNVTALRIETTKPETEGIITFNISKAIKATTNLSRATLFSPFSLYFFPEIWLKVGDLLQPYAWVGLYGR